MKFSVMEKKKPLRIPQAKKTVNEGFLRAGRDEAVPPGSTRISVIDPEKKPVNPSGSDISKGRIKQKPQPHMGSMGLREAFEQNKHKYTQRKLVLIFIFLFQCKIQAWLFLYFRIPRSRLFRLSTINYQTVV